jgi:WD40 repeat protein
MDATKPRIFLSYSRSDGQEFARHLYDRLSAEGLSIWFDRREMEGGRDWWRQIAEALETVEYLLLVMTPNAIRSDIVSKEWRLARKNGVGIVPVAGHVELDLTAIPRWMKKAHFVNLSADDEWQTLISTLQSPSTHLHVPFLAEDLPTDFVPRSSELDQLIEVLIQTQSQGPQAITAALWGAGGYGKTTLAMALCHDERTQEAYSDGILWVTLGKDPGDPTGRIEDLIYTISRQRPGFSTIQSATAFFCDLIRELELLLVIDDVWSPADLKPFLQGGPRCSRLITTRDHSSLPPNIRTIRVDFMSQQEALALLQIGLPRQSPEMLQPLTLRLGRWPILLKLVNGTLRERVASCGQSLPAAITSINRALAHRGLTSFDDSDPADRNRAVSSTLKISLSLFSQFEQQRFFELSVFPDDTYIPIEKITKLWSITGEMDDISTEHLCLRLFRCSLAQHLDLATEHLALHDVVRTFIWEQIRPSLPSLHLAFLEGHKISDWRDLDKSDTYLWKHLPYHLVQANLKSALAELLFSYGWLKASLEATGILNTIDAFNYLQCDDAATLVRQSLQLSAHAMQMNRNELPGQLLGRLHGDTSLRIKNLLECARCESGYSWLRPLNRCLSSPGGPLERTLTGHLAGLCSIAIAPQGTRIVSGSEDCTIRVWDLSSGSHLRTLKGHEGWVSCVAVSPDGQSIVSGSRDGTIRVWNLDSGEHLYTLRGHEGAVLSIALSPDGRYVVSGSRDRTIRIWNISTKEEPQVLRAQDGWVKSLALTPNGKQILSGSTGGTLRLWCIERAALLSEWKAHHGWILSIAITPDGSDAITTSHNSIKIWNISSQTLTCSFTDLKGWPLSVAISPDELHALIGSSNGTLALWNLSNRTVESSVLMAHEGLIEAVTITPDGRHALSAGMDKQLRVWNLDSFSKTRDTTRNASYVTAIAIAEQTNVAISAHRDGTIREWNINTGEFKVILDDNRTHAEIIATSPDGNSIVASLSDGQTLSWNRSLGRPIVQKTILAREDIPAITPDLKEAGQEDPGSQSFTQWLKAYQLIGQWESRKNTSMAIFTSLEVTKDGKQVVAICRDGTVRSWPMLSEKESPIQHQYILADGSIRAWTTDPNMGTLLKGQEKGIEAMALSPNARFAAFGGGRTIRIQNLASGEERLISIAQEGAIRTLAVSSNGERVFVALRDGRILAWDEPLKQCHSQELYDSSVNIVILGRDGQLAIMMCSDRKLRVWDLANDTFFAHHTSDHLLTACAMSPSGPLVAIGDTQGQIHFLKIQAASALA